MIKYILYIKKGSNIVFFIGIFGVEQKEKLVKEFKECVCRHCTTSSISLIKTYSYFHIFFIPIRSWGEKYYGYCANCNILYEVTNDKGKAIEEGEIEELTYWDLIDVEKQNMGNNLCSNCKGVLESKYTYCPYCGKHID
ncbi:zinc ribbon domain-containing protein [Clostridium sp.]|uniref:zinc ribbon domain-containing protein n=1 Tax=Clostridium sp. TaxID=1506 RepID=UPI0034642ABF